MENTAKITGVTANGTFDSKYGIMYKWEIQFDNNDYGEANTKTSPNTTWKIGETVKYIKGKDSKYPNKLELVKEPFVPNTIISKNNDEVQRLIVRQNALTNSVKFHEKNGTSEQDILTTAQNFAEWAMKKP